MRKIKNLSWITKIAVGLFLIIGISFCTSEKEDKELIRGIYGNPGALIKKYPHLSELGINAVFARKSSISEDLMEGLKADGIKIFAEFPLLNGKGYVEKHPEAWPINQRGEKAEPADWFMGVCLTDSLFRASKLLELEEFMNNTSIDGVWLDYLHWHAQFESPDPLLPETCFCEKCIEAFEEFSELKIPQVETQKRAQMILTDHEKKWRKWRAGVLTLWIADCKKIIKEKQPEALLGLYYCPWFPDEHNNALYNNLGLDMVALDTIADVFSPMLYHKKMGRKPEWVKEYITWLSEFTKSSGNNSLIWPIVQAQDDPQRIQPEEFNEVMNYGLSGNSSGVMMFSIHSLMQDSLKINTMKALYTK